MRRTPTLTSAAWALLLLAPAALAWAPAPAPRAADPVTLLPESRLWIDGGSTVRRWTCNAQSLDAAVEAGAGNVPRAVLAGEKAVQAVTFSVPTAQIECGNGTMNDHLRRALKAREHPAVVFRLASYDVTRAGDQVKGRLTGTLTLAGVTKTITLDAQGRADERGALRVTGAYPLRMTEYGIKPPTLMMGTLKVNENVVVSFDLYLKS